MEDLINDDDQGREAMATLGTPRSQMSLSCLSDVRRLAVDLANGLTLDHGPAHNKPAIVESTNLV